MADRTTVGFDFYDTNISLVSYNMHGYNQGLLVAKQFASSQTEIMLFQEHWLTPANMSKFQVISLNTMHLEYRL